MKLLEILSGFTYKTLLYHQPATLILQWRISDIVSNTCHSEQNCNI